MSGWLPALLTIAACAATGCEERPMAPARYPPPDPRPSPGFTAVWAELTTPAEVDAAVALLRDHGLSVNLAWPASALHDAARLKLVADAASAGVEVRPWLLLDRAEGYWPGSTNAERFAEEARRLFDVWDDAGLAPTWFIVDMEMHIERADAMAALLHADPPDLAGLLALLQDGVDRDRFAAATAVYRTLVNDAHARGWRVMLTTLPQLLDDAADGDDSVAQALGTPIDGIDWDVVSFQVYRSLLNDFAGSGGPPLTSFIVYDYARDAVSRFGDRAGLDLGLVQAGVAESSAYDGPEALREDIAAARAAGVPAARLQVYSLGGVLARTPSEAWLAPPESAPAPPEPDAAAMRLRALIRALDAANGSL